MYALVCACVCAHGFCLCFRFLVSYPRSAPQSCLSRIIQSSLGRRPHLLLIFYSVSFAVYSVSFISLCQIVPLLTLCRSSLLQLLVTTLRYSDFCLYSPCMHLAWPLGFLLLLFCILACVAGWPLFLLCVVTCLESFCLPLESGPCLECGVRDCLFIFVAPWFDNKLPSFSWICESAFESTPWSLTLCTWGKKVYGFWNVCPGRKAISKKVPFFVQVNVSKDLKIMQGGPTVPEMIQTYRLHVCFTNCCAILQYFFKFKLTSSVLILNVNINFKC